MGRELPPHTRRKASALLDFAKDSGTTSAYAEKRAPALRFHLGCRELPPHTRRKDLSRVFVGFPGGTTSAYAEKRKITHN
ncbi:Hypothetical protein CUL131002_1769c [Corynebacterium ulcerans]|nr:Hypothetical protein CUL131002_1769c [Corynebacterium ulcerans]